MEAVLGRDGVGLADCAIAESKFEKGEDISPRMLPLVQRMNDIRYYSGVTTYAPAETYRNEWQQTAWYAATKR